MSDAAFDAWVEEAKNASIEQVALSWPGLHLRKAGRDLNGACPTCGSTDSFVVTPNGGPGKQFLCRKGGKPGGVVQMVAHLMNVEAKGKDFVRICEAIVGRPPPGRDTSYRAPDPDAERERAKDRRDSEMQRAMAAEKAAHVSIEQCLKILETCQPFMGSHADAYLRARAIEMTEEDAADFHFHPGLPYWGYDSYDGDAPMVNFGLFPAQVAVFRRPNRDITGLHITYLDPNEPAKLSPPGTTDNKAKKIRGPYMGGLIYIGPVMPIMAIGEGIETTRSWRDLDRAPKGVHSYKIGIAAAGSMVNLAGQPVGHVKPVHPTKRPSVPDILADMDKPGFLPVPGVEGYIFLGDGDSEKEWTWRNIMVACDRARRDECQAWVDFAPNAEQLQGQGVKTEKGWDWNDFKRWAA